MGFCEGFNQGLCKLGTEWLRDLGFKLTRDFGAWGVNGTCETSLIGRAPLNSTLGLILGYGSLISVSLLWSI